MRVTSTQRWVSVGLLLLFAYFSLELADRLEWGWYFVAAVLLAFAWLVLQLPGPMPVTPRASEVVSIEERRRRQRPGWAADVDRAVESMSWDYHSGRGRRR